MKHPHSRLSLLASLLFALAAVPATAQYAFTDSNLLPYTQDFDSLEGNVAFTYGTSSLPSMIGVYAEAQADPQYGNGSLFPSTVPANDGSMVSGNYYHFGKSGEADRAFGGIAETGMYTGTGYVGIRLKNSTSVTILNLEIQYAMEQWYNSGNAAAASVNVSYRKSSGVAGENIASLSSVAVGAPWTPVPGLTVQAPSTGTVIQSRDGNSPANRRVVQATLADIDIAPGQEIMIRWDYVLNPTTNGNGVSIDDVRITPQTNVFFAQGTAINVANGLSGSIRARSTTPLDWRNAAGAAPASLGAPNQTYYVTGSVNAADLTGITGTNVKIIIGIPAQNNDPTQKGLLMLTDNTILGVPVDISAGSTLRIEEGAGTMPLSLGLLATTSTVVYAGTATAQTIQPASYGKLALEGAGPKVLGGSILVNGNLQLSGTKLSLGAFDATLTKGSSVVGADAASYLVTGNGGRLRQSVLSDNVEVRFPVGTATRYLPLTMRQSASRSEDVFAVQVSDDKYATYTTDDTGIGAPISLAKSVNKTWFVSEEVKGNAHVTLRLQWKAIDQTSDFDPARAYVTHFQSGGFWDRTTTEVGAVLVGATPDTYTLDRSGITSFSPFSISSDASSPLPVELISFDAKRVENIVSCTWATASEKDNAYFALERSLNGHVFSVIGSTAGAGTSLTRHFYSLPDLQPATATAYYRLRQVDIDGRSGYSPVIAVKGSAISLANSPQLLCYPNPAHDAVQVRIIGITPAATLCVLDAVGRAVYTRAPAAATDATTVLPLVGLPAGVYVVRYGALSKRLMVE